jgi:hypothetical protein
MTKDHYAFEVRLELRLKDYERPDEWSGRASMFTADAWQRAFVLLAHDGARVNTFRARWRCRTWLDVGDVMHALKFHLVREPDSIIAVLANRGELDPWSESLDRAVRQRTSAVPIIPPGVVYDGSGVPCALEL